MFASHGFKKGDFVVEYHGDLLELPEAKAREDKYAEDPQTGCYMYYFQYKSKTYWYVWTLSMMLLFSMGVKLIMMDG